MESLAGAGGRIAFFGGSFDPPHLGHLAVARAARDALALDTVLFAPVGAQPLKPQGASADFSDRLAMTKLAIAGQPGLAISLVDAPKSGALPNYTVDTLLELRAGLASGGALFCLMGADSFLGLRHWRRGAEIPFIAPLIVASRPGEQLDELAAALPTGLTIVPAPALGDAFSNAEVHHFQVRDSRGRTAPFFLLPGLQVEISASQIREQVRARSLVPAPERELLSTAVADYIRSQRLYS